MDDFTLLNQLVIIVFPKAVVFVAYHSETVEQPESGETNLVYIGLYIYVSVLQNFRSDLEFEWHAMP